MQNAGEYPTFTPKLQRNRRPVSRADEGNNPAAGEPRSRQSAGRGARHCTQNSMAVQYTIFDFMPDFFGCTMTLLTFTIGDCVVEDQYDTMLSIRRTIIIRSAEYRWSRDMVP
ncbi:hypothetical protein MELA_02620 [Candidatus Methylomirabilis lanthanidiphila]|uniref:Uncharacterized protein n=1 Tax=Candidatus Methylomirabilis lanthanidiphila TaxID=2211376 RepID=A0A564ZLK2_9BACT|nr:hypothetical protein MELA_02620 [Candidatus Methylomirabilis lanthanidiphila]